MTATSNCDNQLKKKKGLFWAQIQSPQAVKTVARQPIVATVLGKGSSLACDQE